MSPLGGFGGMSPGEFCYFVQFGVYFDVILALEIFLKIHLLHNIMIDLL